MDNPFADVEISSDEENVIDYSCKQNQNNSDNSNPIEFQRDSVSAVNQCQSDEAKKLCIFNLDYKLKHGDQYDIGGTYTNTSPDLWFYCTTSTGPDGNCTILNLFVCHRNIGTFFVGISEYKILNKVKTKDPYSYYLSMSDKLTEKTFNSIKKDQSHYLATYCFMTEDFSELEDKKFCIPVKIKINPKCPVDKLAIINIKTIHGVASLFKRHEDTDFILQSKSGTNYETHKLILAAHSLVLKEIIRSTNSNCAPIDIGDEEMELMLEFMYTGTVKTVLDKNLHQLLELAYKFKIKNLNVLTQHTINDMLTISNAIDIAVLTEKYHLDSLQKTVFEFIKKNSQVLDSESWHNLNDVALTKKLCKEIYAGNNLY